MPLDPTGPHHIILRLLIMISIFHINVVSFGRKSVKSLAFPALLHKFTFFTLSLFFDALLRHY